MIALCHFSSQEPDSETDVITSYSIHYTKLYDPYLERKHNLPAAKRVVAVYRQRLVVDARDEKAAGLPLVVLHQDGGADLPVLLGNVLDAIGEHQRLVPRAEDLVAVSYNFV